eukprot:TRINITY_DN22025_c0_g1_i1.p1 TRINITY_DN22025_c0_g1~~TRINITY_DN22025_c0_g1_i1.p1  ORF type:complete len:715 (+),score=98.69 TRINITY_DN22025_c0_g1_i1:189-2333(+)
MANADVVEYLQRLKTTLDDQIRRKGVDRAIASVQKYPIRLVGEEDAKHLVGVGEWIGKKIGGYLRGKQVGDEGVVDVDAVEGVLSQHCAQTADDGDEGKEVELHIPEEVKTLKVAELKAKLKSHNLLVSGNKQTLVERYAAFLQKPTSSQTEPQQSQPVRKPKTNLQFPVSLLSKNGQYPSIRYGSTSYALMLAFHKLTATNEDGHRVASVITEAQKYTKTKLTTPQQARSDPRQWFATAAHPLRTTLLNNSLIEPTGTDRYKLTEVGREYSAHLWACHTLEVRVDDVKPGGKRRSSGGESPVKKAKVEYVVVGGDDPNPLDPPEPTAVHTPPRGVARDPELAEILEWGRELGVSSPPPKIPSPGKRKKSLPRRSNTPSKRLVTVNGQQAIVRSPTPSRNLVLPERVDWRTYSEQPLPTRKKNSFALKLSKSPYKVLCVVDHRERHWGTLFVDKLTAKGIPCVSRSLEVGDFTWVASSPDGSETLLDIVIERKRVQDLAGSIVGGRYNDQKQRMLKAGARHLVYLVEGKVGDSKGVQGSAIETALLTTCMFDGMFVEHTVNVDGTLNFLASLHRKFEDLLADCDGSKPPNIRPHYPPTPSPFGQASAHYISPEPLSFADFNEASRILRTDTTATTIFPSQLACIKGLSFHGATSITEHYPTALSLYNKYQEYAAQNRTALAELCLSTIPTKSAKTRFIGDHCSSLVYKAFTEKA